MIIFDFLINQSFQSRQPPMLQLVYKKLKMRFHFISTLTNVKPVCSLQGDLSGKLMKPCDDEDCIEGSGSNVDETTEPEHPITT